MKRKIKLLSLVLTLALLISLSMVACSQNNAIPSASTQSSGSANAATTASTPEPKLDRVNLVGYVLGEAPADGPAVMAEISKKLEADINATVQLNYIPFADISTKLPLVLATPQDWDFIYASIDYGSNASKGAYREITMADVEKNMPLTFQETSKSAWADTLVKGKTYMIPQSFKELAVAAIFYREDLRKKYNVPEIKSSADWEAYLTAVKENEPGMVPFDGNTGDINGFLQVFMESWPFNILTIDYLTVYNPDDSTFKITGLLDDDFIKTYKKAAETMKKFHDAGLIPANAFAQKTSSIDLALAGKTAVWGNSFENYPQYCSDMKAKGWELGVFPILTPNGTGLQRPATGNGFAFSPVSKNYERAMMAVDKITQEQSYNMLASFGIEGKNYVIKDGKLALGPDIDPANNPYPMYGAGLWSTNRDKWPPLENYTQDYIDLKKQLQAHAVSYLLTNMNVNTDSIKTEIANCTNVVKQYELPINLGMVKDVDAAIKELQEKLKAAGALKVVDEVKRQADEYVKAHTVN